MLSQRKTEDLILNNNNWKVDRPTAQSAGHVTLFIVGLIFAAAGVVLLAFMGSSFYGAYGINLIPNWSQFPWYVIFLLAGIFLGFGALWKYPYYAAYSKTVKNRLGYK
jgi:hypothetical protein